MKGIKRQCLLAIISMVCIQGMAMNPDGGDKFIVYTNGTSKATVYQLDNLDKMVFGETALSLFMTTGKTDYAYSNLTKIIFSSGSGYNGIEQLKLDTEILNVRYDRQSSVLHVESDVSLKSITVYDTRGHQHSSMRSEGKKFNVSLSHLEKGVYVILIKGDGIEKSIKVIK